MLIAASACGGGRRSGGDNEPGTPTAPVPGPRPLSLVFVLESSGVPPEDTVATFRAGAPRVIIVRRGAPDNSLFVEIATPGDTAAAAGADSSQVTIRPVPGMYGVDIGGTGLQAGSRLTFSYGLQFTAPAGARERYGSDLAFERMLLVARVEADSQVVFLPTTRPGSDLASALVSGPGRYIVAAPR